MHVKSSVKKLVCARHVAPSSSPSVNFTRYVTHYAFALRVSRAARFRSEEHTSELQSLMRISYAVFCLKKKKNPNRIKITISCISLININYQLIHYNELSLA